MNEPENKPVNRHEDAVPNRVGFGKRRDGALARLTAPERALVRETTGQARQLKRKHHGLYSADPRRFRKLLRTAQNMVFRQKPGPKPDRVAAQRIARAARMLARGVQWEELFPKFIAGYEQLNTFTQGYAEEGFRRKVNKHLRKRKRPNKRGKAGRGGARSFGQRTRFRPARHHSAPGYVKLQYDSNSREG